MIHVIATIELREQSRDAFLSDFARLRPEVLAEPGCIEYAAATDLATGIAAQIPVRENTVTVIEKWADPAALAAHLDARHMREHRDRTAAFVSRITLQVLTPA